MISKFDELNNVNLIYIKLIFDISGGKGRSIIAPLLC